MRKSELVTGLSGLLFLFCLFSNASVYGQEIHHFSVTIDSLKNACLMARQSLKVGNTENLLYAARIISEIGPSPSAADHYLQGGEGALPEPDLKYEPAWLVKRAQRLEQEMKTLEKMYADSELESLLATLRGNDSNPHVTMFNTIVRPLAQDEYQISFTDEEMAEIMVIGSGNTCLDIFVYDLSGHLIAKNKEEGYDCMVAWQPEKTQLYVIKITNRGNEFNSYTLLTN